MNSNGASQPIAGQSTTRARAYGVALIISLCYALVGALNNDYNTSAQVDLTVSAASVLLLSLAGAEIYLHLQRIQRGQAELQVAQDHERELAQRLAYQRQSILSQISRALINRLDFNQMPREVLENVAQLFEAEVIVTWMVEAPGRYALKDAFGLNAHTTEQLQGVPWTFSEFPVERPEPRLVATENAGDRPTGEFATFCQRERLESAALTPIVRRKELVGVIGICYRRSMTISPSLAAEMQTVANVIASAIQAEELYRDLVQVQKIDSIGTLTSGVAHDFNNVLAAVLACATYVKQQTDSEHPTYHYLESIENSAHRGAALTKQLLAFARREAPKVSVVSAQQCIEQTFKMLDRSFEKTILIQRQFAPDLKSCEVDPSQLEQVILNLAVNARDAMGDSGIFTITTRNARLDAADPHRPKIALPDGEYVALGFRDTGHGMDAATLQRIFEPFFTTKRVGKGTGLGLSLVHNIVKSFAGEIRVDSAPGKGTFFEVYLPATNKPLPPEAKTEEHTARGGKETILLAEDEDVIREMAALDLESKGYNVIAASDGATALAKYREHWQGIDLVIADMVMPRMNGAELFARMKEINPQVRVVVSSGYSHDQEGQRMMQHGCLGYLQKPYTPEALNRITRSVLDSGL